jgi:hypothetical protein
MSQTESTYVCILTVLSAGRRDCRSFVGAVVHEVGVWGSEFPILRGGSSGAVLSEWSVRDSLTMSSRLSLFLIPRLAHKKESN